MPEVRKANTLDRLERSVFDVDFVGPQKLVEDTLVGFTPLLYLRRWMERHGGRGGSGGFFMMMLFVVGGCVLCVVWSGQIFWRVPVEVYGTLLVVLVRM